MRRMARRLTMVLLSMGFPWALAGAQGADVNHVVVKKPEPGRAFGWPANGGIWSWGYELLVMYLDCPYKDNPGFSNHDSDQKHPSARWVTSRSTDGGMTWTEHRVAFSDPRANPAGSKPATLAESIDFSHRDTVVNFHWDGLGAAARTYFYYSADRGRTWKGPYDNIPLFDFVGMAGRTDYEVTGRHSLTAYIGCLEVADASWYRESSYAVSTHDGGMTWEKGPRISRPLPPAGAGHRIEYGAMPSTVRIDSHTLVSTFRSGYTPAKGRRMGWIDVARSTDNGQTWRMVNGYLMEMPTLNSSPPALNRLPDGRLVCSWGWRLPDDGSGPTGIQACISSDNGDSWGETLTLRLDGFDYDIGYNRQAVRPDGKIVTVYYYRTKADGQSPTYIAATIWTPPAAPSRSMAARSPAVYYVDAVRGDDNNTGTSLDQAWRTLQHAADSAPQGAAIHVRAGTYRETVRPQSGQTFVAYPGEKPLITGCDRVSGWTVHSGSIYKAAVPAKVLDVFVGTAPMPKARHPNEEGDPLTCDEWETATNALESAGGRGTGKVTLSQTSRPAGHWVGGWYSGVHGKNPFMVAEGRITASSGSELTCTDLGPGWKGAYGQMWGEGRGYITDHLNCLDAENEWHWQDGTLYFWAPGGGAPANVETRTRIYGIVLTNRSNVTLKGLYFLGASVQVNGGSDNMLDGCHFRNVSPWGAHHYTDARNYYWGGTVDGTSGIHLSGTNHVIQNCSVVGGWGHGIHLAGGGNLTVSNNYIADFGWSGRFVQSPVSGFGTGVNIIRNTIRRSSGPGIFLYQKNPGDGANVNHVKQVRILHNDIRDCGYLLDDSGNAFIYIQNADVPSADRALHGEIAYNVLIRQLGGQGRHHTGGIYLDNGTDFCTIHHNVVDMQETKNPRTAAIFLNAAGHNQENILAAHNTLWGYRGGHMFGGAIVFSTGVDKGGRQTGVVVRNNLAQHDPVLRLNDWPYGESNKGAGVTQSHNRGNVPGGEFVDASSGNFRLNTGSASIDAGVVIPGVNDAGSASPYTGEAPDLGAYEHGGRDWTAGSSVAPPHFPVMDGTTDLTVIRADGPPAASDESVILRQTLRDGGGNTRFRFYPQTWRTGDPESDEPTHPILADEYATLHYFPDREPAGKIARRYSLRDRDLGQVFTVPKHLKGPLYLRAVTLRTGPDKLANQGGAGGAKVAMQLLEVAGGPPTIHDNGTRDGDNAKWHTFAPGRPTTDDYVSGHTFIPITVARGGVLPADIDRDEYMRWELSGRSRIRLEPGKTYAWMVGFDEPGEHCGLALANRNTAAWEQPIPFGPMKGGYAIRRSGSNDFHQVFFDPDDPQDTARGLDAASLPIDPEKRWANTDAIGTAGYPDVDTYRDFYFYLHATPDR